MSATLWYNKVGAIYTDMASRLGTDDLPFAISNIAINLTKIINVLIFCYWYNWGMELLGLLSDLKK
jgi:hypothetical protein